MRVQTVRTEPNIGRSAVHRSLQTVGVGHDAHHRGLYEEPTWRCPAAVVGWSPIGAEILISRWVDRRSFRRYEKAVSSSDRHVIGVALKTTQLK